MHASDSRILIRTSVYILEVTSFFKNYQTPSPGSPLTWVPSCFAEVMSCRSDQTYSRGARTVGRSRWRKPDCRVNTGSLELRLLPWNGSSNIHTTCFPEIAKAVLWQLPCSICKLERDVMQIPEACANPEMNVYESINASGSSFWEWMHPRFSLQLE